MFREVWRDGLWTKEDDEEMVIEKMEAQAWICLYNLLSTREVATFVSFVIVMQNLNITLLLIFMSTQGDGEISSQ